MQLCWRYASVVIFQHHQRMGLTFHNSYVILELVSSTLIFCTELSCWCKSCENKATLLLDWSHRYTNNTVVITIWLTVRKYIYLKWQWMFYFLRRSFLFLYHCRDFYRTWLYRRVTRRRSYKKQEVFTLRDHLSLLPVFEWDPSSSSLYFFFCCSIMCRYVLSCVVCCPLRFPHEHEVPFVLIASCLYDRSCLIYIICLCLW
jgi:hypothetical protein